MGPGGGLRWVLMVLGVVFLWDAALAGLLFFWWLEPTTVLLVFFPEAV